MSNCIYIIKNFANNKIYIGKTEREGDVDEIAKKRFQEHIQESFNENNKAYTYCISRAIRKWGVQAFDYAILARNVPSEDLLLIEEHYIDMYNACDPQCGYNMSSGYNDNSDYQIYEESKPNDDYDDASRVNIENTELTNEDMERFLREL